MPVSHLRADLLGPCGLALPAWKRVRLGFLWEGEEWGERCERDMPELELARASWKDIFGSDHKLGHVFGYEGEALRTACETAFSAYFS